MCKQKVNKSTKTKKKMKIAVRSEREISFVSIVFLVEAMKNTEIEHVEMSFIAFLPSDSSFERHNTSNHYQIQFVHSDLEPLAQNTRAAAHELTDFCFLLRIAFSLDNSLNVKKIFV
jgi:hypothetical protein